MELVPGPELQFKIEWIMHSKTFSLSDSGKLNDRQVPIEPYKFNLNSIP
jgi:hypothetical protein